MQQEYKIKISTIRMMKNQEAKWRKQAEKPAKWNEGYCGVAYEDVWNLNDRLASIISRHLHASLRAAKGLYGGCPAILDKGNSDEAYKRWLQIICDMIYTFDNIFSKEMSSDADISDPHIIEIRKRVRKGMQLFIDYFNHLWI